MEHVKLSINNFCVVQRFVFLYCKLYILLYIYLIGSGVYLSLQNWRHAHEYLYICLNINLIAIFSSESYKSQ
jgi:hypothetical protein